MKRKQITKTHESDGTRSEEGNQGFFLVFNGAPLHDDRTELFISAPHEDETMFGAWCLIDH